MDIALVTGANTRIGLAISRKLIEIGCRVYGLGGNFSEFPLEHSDFVPVTCDLTNTEHLCQVVQKIIEKEQNIYVLVNHARFLNLKSHEEQDLNDLEALVHTNLLAPLILTRLALPSLIRLRGYVLNIGFPDLPGSHRLGSSFLSTEVALQEFSDRLYEEVRQDKVKVCSLILDTANVESLFREGFTERDNHDLIVCSETTAQAVEYVISQRRESVVSRLVVRPQKRQPDESDRQQARKLPAPKPYTASKSSRKVTIGRLKKELASEPDEKGPATYMDMAREMAEEEARRQNVSEQVSEHPPKRRRPRRGRRRSSRDSSGLPKGGSGEHATKKPQDSSKPSASTDSNEGKDTTSKPKQNDAVPHPKQGFRGPGKKSITKKAARKRAGVKKSASKKEAARKKSSGRAPAANEETKSDTEKLPLRKSVKKRTAKKTARKRAASGKKDSNLAKSLQEE